MAISALLESEAPYACADYLGQFRHAVIAPVVMSHALHQVSPDHA